MDRVVKDPSDPQMHRHRPHTTGPQLHSTASTGQTVAPTFPPHSLVVGPSMARDHLRPAADHDLKDVSVLKSALLRESNFFRVDA